MLGNTDNNAITQAILDNAGRIEILSGEGEYGTEQRYTGARTVRAVRARLTRERAGGDRWAILIVDNERIG